MEEGRSEFGRGLVYCLGLFLAHQFQWGETREILKENWAQSWFNGASDHLYELQYDKAPTQQLKDRLKTLREKGLNWGHGFKEVLPTEKDMDWAISEAKDILLEIDKFYSVPAEKGDWD